MHLEEDINFTECKNFSSASSLARLEHYRHLTNNIRKHTFMFKKSAEKLLHFQKKLFPTVQNTVL